MVVNYYNVLGFYKDEAKQYSSEHLYIEKEHANQIMYDAKYETDYSSQYYELSVYVKDKNKLNDNLKNILINEYDYTVKSIKETKSDKILSSIIYILISLAVSFLIIYFLVRSSIYLRINEVSVLRSLGKSKREIRQIFNLEMIILTTFSSLIGFIIGALISNGFSTYSFDGVFEVRVTPLSFLIIILTIYLTNIIVNLIPVNSLLRKTPAEMLTNYDL